MLDGIGAVEVLPHWGDSEELSTGIPYATFRIDIWGNNFIGEAE